MKKTSLFLTCILFTLVISNAFAKDSTTLAENISIKEGNKTFDLSKNPDIILDSFNFDVCIDNISTKQDVFLFAYYKADYMNKYSFPVNKDETEIFCIGSAIAESDLDQNKGYSLSINEPFTFHYLHEKRRINKDNSCILPVRKITDPTGNFSDKLCLSIFVDYNNNTIIEENEYAAVELSFSSLVSFDLNDFSEENRGYVSAFGKAINSENYNNKAIQAYKITSEKDFEKFIKLTKKNFLQKTPKDYFKHYFDQKNMNNKDKYLLMAPNNMSFKSNPFRITGSKNIYFEVTETAANDTPVSLIALSKDKNEADFQIYVLINGEPVPVTIKSF